MTITSHGAILLQFVPIPKDIAASAREEMRDRFSHSLTVTQASAPCRSCLRISKVPEDLILLSYRPLADKNPYAEIGPVFIHAHSCEAYSKRHIFPEDFLPRSLLVRAYDANGAIVDAALAGPGDAQRCAVAFLEDAKVQEIHVRSATYGCYFFRVIRA